MPAEVPPRLRPLTPKPAPFPKAGSSGAYGATQVAQRTKQLPFSLVGTWTQWFQSSQFEFAFKTNQTMRILGGIFVVAFLFFVVLATTSECSMFMFILLFFFFFYHSKRGKKRCSWGRFAPFEHVGPSGWKACVGSRGISPSPASASKSPQNPGAAQDTPRHRLRRQRQEAAPKPHEGTTQIAIISSLAKTSNSPNYPVREKKNTK